MNTVFNCFCVWHLHCYGGDASLNTIVAFNQLRFGTEEAERISINVPPHSEACFDPGWKWGPQSNNRSLLWPGFEPRFSRPSFLPLRYLWGCNSLSFWVMLGHDQLLQRTNCGLAGSTFSFRPGDPPSILSLWVIFASILFGFKLC